MSSEKGHVKLEDYQPKISPLLSEIAASSRPFFNSGFRGLSFWTMKTIHRRKLRANFTTLPNILLREKSLSFKARGILSMMLSHSEEWRGSMKSIEEFGTEGRESIRSGIRELEMSGYAVRQTLVNQEGKFTGVLWTWHDTPVPLSERSNPNDGKPSDGKPSADKPSVGKPSQIRRLSVEDNLKERMVLKREITDGGGGGILRNPETNEYDW